MNFSSILLFVSAPVVGASWLGNRSPRTFTAPHEVHQYEQTKFFDEPEWECSFEDVAGAVGCLKCGNPRGENGDALIVEVKAQYKRPNWNIKDADAAPPRKHCVFPGRGEFWTCFNSNLVIEPDTDWLGAAGFKDKPIYDIDGNEGGDLCLPGSIAGAIADNGAIYA